MPVRVNTDNFTPKAIADACPPCPHKKTYAEFGEPSSGTCELGPGLLAVVEQRGVTEQEMKAGINYVLGKTLDRSPDACPLQEASGQEI
jgi:hypothetical protein